MKYFLKLAGISFAIALSVLVIPTLIQPVWITAAVASEQNAEYTQAFTIEKMTCAACPITVKKAMQRVDGVIGVAINFDTKTAVATFDPALTNADEIAAASTNVGYPAIAIENVPQ